MIIKSILVPLEIPHPHNVLNYAIFFAKRLKAELRGLYVKDIRLIEGSWFNLLGAVSKANIRKEDIVSMLNERSLKVKDYFTTACKDEGLQCSFQIQEGLISDIIIKAAKDIDLVVMGKKGEHRRWLRGYLGSVFLRVFDRVNNPLLALDNTQPKNIKKILLCYAGGYFAQKAMELAECLAIQMGFELLVLTIATEKVKAISVQKKAKEYFDQKKVNAKYLLTIGKVRSEIERICKVENVDMIITGASLHRRYEDFLSFSLANEILYKTRIPILFAK